MNDIARIELEITDLGENGEGIGRHEGMAVFVPGALPGERIVARIKFKKKSFAHGELVETLKSSENRITPPCPVAEVCGGCQIQELDYAAQLTWKHSHVKACMERIAKLPQVPVEPVIGMKDPWHYRNKAIYFAAGSRTEPLLGFYRRGSNQVVEAEDCLIQHAGAGEIIMGVKELMVLHGIQPYSPHTESGHVRHLLLRRSLKGEWLLAVVTAGKALPRAEAFSADLKGRFPQIATLLVNRNPHGDHRMLGGRTDILFGPGVLQDAIEDIAFQISPESFFQVNPVQTEVLYGKALDFAGLSGKETVLDLYCGIGTISLFLARSAAKVIGVEVVSRAVADAKENAVRNGISNVEFICGTAEDTLPQLVKNGVRPDVVVVDPPRKGCERSALEAILQMAPQRIVYVSCKPATLARDLAILVEGGYRVEQVQPVDQFPHSVHVETVVLMSRVDK